MERANASTSSVDERLESLLLTADDAMLEHQLQDVGSESSSGLDAFDSDFLVPGEMELQTGVLVDETLKINASGVAVRACEGRGNGQVDDLDMNLLSDLLPPSGEFEAQAAAPKTIPGDASPTADSSDATESSSGNEELVMRERSVAGSGRPKRPKKSVSTSSLSSSSSSADVEMEAEVLQEGNGEIIDRKARRRAQVASSARRLRCRKKNEMMMLKTEASILEQQLEGLRLKHKQMRANGAVAAWEEMAIAQRHKRRQAEQTHEQLRHALFLQSGFMRNLKSMFSQSMPCSIELNMRNLLHTPTHLLKESSESRVRGLEAVCTEAKLDMAKRIVLDETGSITPFTTPHISCQQIDLGASCFGMTTVAVYALETKNACKTFKSVCNAVLNCAAMWPNYSLVNSSLKLVDVPPTKLNIRYGVAHQVYQSDATGDQVSVETREVSYYKWTDGRGILLWDYVDADDVHPLQKDTTAVRCTIGAVLVQPEICLDGVERMVCRNICTKVHMVDKSEVTPAIERFSKSRQLCARMSATRQLKVNAVLQSRTSHRNNSNPRVGSDMNLLGLLADTELDSGLLSDLLLEDDDGMLELTGEGSTLTSGTPTAAENDETSSSDDTSGSPGSPAVNSKLEPKRWDKVTDRKAKRRAQVAVSARRHRYRKKHEMLDLRKEVGELTEQLHSLRSKHKLLRPNGQAEEYAMAQRHKRRQSEEMNEQLRRALVMQRRFFNSMQAFVLNSPITNAELNMCSLLHTFTRLGKMPYSRQRDYLALCTDSKADLAVQILLRETEGMNFAGPPSIVTRVVPAQSMQQQIVTTVGAYAFDTLDLKSVFASACDGILGCGTEWPQYKAVSQHGEVKDKPKGNIRYGVSGTSYQRLGVAATQVVSVESRSIIFYRMSTDHGVLVWDFADEDDLYPVKPEATIKLDLTGAAMVRREMCPDGAERVVCRSICTKLQSFSLPPAASEVSYYLQQSAKGAKMCGFAVYNHIREHASQDTMVAV